MIRYFLALSMALLLATAASATPQVTLTHIKQSAGTKTLAVALTFAIEPGLHINAHRPTFDYLIPTALSIEPAAAVLNIAYPEPEKKSFGFSPEPLAVHEGSFEVRAELARAAAGQTLAGELRYQACNDEVCFAPETLKLSIPIQAAAEATTGSTPAKNESGSWRNWQDIAGKPLLLKLLIVFFGGLLMNLTPCVYPMIPVTVTFFSSQKQAAGLLAACYVAGVTATFTALGVVTALTGSLFGAMLQHPAVQLGLAGFMLALAAWSFGWFELRLPQSLSQKLGTAAPGRAGALAMGLTMGLVAAPCIGPFITILLLHIAKSGSAGYGALLFFTFSLGIGLPYLALGVWVSKLSALPRSGPWMLWFKKLVGGLILILAVFYISPVLSPSAARWAYAAAIAAGLAVLLLDETLSKRAERMLRVLAAGAAIAGVFWLSQPAPAGPAWKPFHGDYVVRAVQSGRPVLIDAVADWCLPCKQMDLTTYKDPRVLDALERFELLRLDLTFQTPGNRETSDYFRISGVPTVILIHPDGREAARRSGAVNAEEMLEMIGKVNPDNSQNLTTETTERTEKNRK